MPIPQADVNDVGIVGDRQRNLKHHGGPTRALCLFSLEKILELQTEGHPIYPGSIGENLTISGLDWDKIVPGVQLKIGELHVEVTSYTVPCSNIKRSFVGQKFGRVSAKKHPGWARTYVSILQEGTIKVGDAVEIVTQS